LARLVERLVAAAGRWHGERRKVAGAVGGGLMSAALYLILLLSVISIAGGNYNPFIYFRF